MKTLFIYNPHAGQMQIKNHLFDILNTFSAANYDLTVVPTKASGEASTYVKKNAKNYDLIVCSGGDGTLNETINGLLKANIDKKPNLGYIPAGSTNDYANSIGLPKNMKKAAEVITSGITKVFDMGKFNNRFFVYVAAFGVFTDVSYATPQDIKNALGHFAYILNGIKSISDIKAYEMTIKANKQTYTGKFIYGGITNTYSIGGLYQLNKKEVDLSDGLFEVVLIRQPKTAIDLAEINAFLIGTNKNSNMVITFKTDKLSIETKDDVPWTLDGEYGGNPSKITIKNYNKVVNIIVPNKTN